MGARSYTQCAASAAACTQAVCDAVVDVPSPAHCGTIQNMHAAAAYPTNELHHQRSQHQFCENGSRTQ